MLQMYTLFQNLHRCRALLPLRLLPDGSSLQRPCQQQLCHGAPASNSFPMALCRSAPSQLLSPAARTSSSATALRPATSSRRLFTAAPLPVATLSGRPSQLLSPAVRTSSFAMAPLASKFSRWHSRPATNLIRRRRVLRFG